MRSFIKYLLIFIGGILIGFGIGIVSTNFLASQKTGYWIAIVSSLILGGFFMALGMTARTSSFKKEAPRTEKTENYSNKAENNYPLSQESDSDGEQ